MTRRQPDIEKMKHVLGRPLVPVEQGIKRLIAHKKAAGR